MVTSDPYPTAVEDPVHLPIAKRAFTVALGELIRRREHLTPKELISMAKVVGDQMVAMHMLNLPIDEIRGILNGAHDGEAVGRRLTGGNHASNTPRLGSQSPSGEGRAPDDPGASDGDWESDGDEALADDAEASADDLALDPPA